MFEGQILVSNKKIKRVWKHCCEDMAAFNDVNSDNIKDCLTGRIVWRGVFRFSWNGPGFIIGGSSARFGRHFLSEVNMQDTVYLVVHGTCAIGGLETMG